MTISLYFIRQFCRAILIILISNLHVANSVANPLNPAAMTLQNKLIEIQPTLQNNLLGFPVYVTSSVKNSLGIGDIYGIFDLDFTTLHHFFAEPTRWCNALILHIYIKSCVLHNPAYVKHQEAALFNVYLGTKDYAKPDDVFRFQYQLKQHDISDEYVKIVLSAEDGPIDTNNYVIIFEAMPISPTQSLIHFRYEANYGFFARSAVSVYLATVGRRHVGFSTIDTNAEAQPIFIKGLRGVIERNAMRYVISVVSYLQADNTDPNQWLESSLKRWYHYSEIFRAQLHDASLSRLLTIKTEEFKNQQRLSLMRLNSNLSQDETLDESFPRE